MVLEPPARTALGVFAHDVPLALLVFDQLVLVALAVLLQDVPVALDVLVQVVILEVPSRYMQPFRLDGLLRLWRKYIRCVV